MTHSLRWSHTHFICIPAVHIISFSVSFRSLVDELNKLASLQYMGLHSSAGRALQRYAEATGSNPVEAPKNRFFGLFSQSLKLPHYHIKTILRANVLIRPRLELVPVLGNLYFNYYGCNSATPVPWGRAYADDQEKVLTIEKSVSVVELVLQGRH